ncbi:hypothetical protein SAMN05421820_105325 [Pedobacter steynii]|uniref:Uncharacterized protein n=1 Tax=Pedobacter steynii TaxID=430522 RepID=A0A1G9WZR6_9SPHI|nr:hypothetical protein SAMN05421820_105325 [Pedobacter steynii]
MLFLYLNYLLSSCLSVVWGCYLGQTESKMNKMNESIIFQLVNEQFERALRSIL